MRPSVHLMQVVFLLSGALAFICATPPELISQHKTVNAVLGDVSYEHTFGHAPAEWTDEGLRIRTHLAYVEKLLESRDLSMLPPHIREARRANVSRLKEYRERGAFPVNEDHPGERQPCFIDRYGNICAVGYLIEQSAGRHLAESINASYQYDYIIDMESAELNKWVAASGLTIEECAMIQPQYDFSERQEEPKFNKTLEATNISIGAASLLLNGVLTGSGTKSYVASGVGFLSGTAGILLGASDRANYRLTDVLVGSAAVLSSVAHLVFTASEAETETRALRRSPYPEVGVAVLRSEDNSVLLGLNLRWRM